MPLFMYGYAKSTIVASGFVLCCCCCCFVELLLMSGVDIMSLVSVIAFQST